MFRRQVEQHTFDNIVRESIEEFGLSPEEAVQDAIEQLKKTGVTDFSNISTFPPSSSPTSSSHPSHTDDASSEGKFLEKDTEIPECSALRHAIEANDIEGLLNAVKGILSLLKDSTRRIGDAKTVVELCISALFLTHEGEQREPAIACCTLISILCSKDEANRAYFTMTDGVMPLKALVKDAASSLTPWKAVELERLLRAVAAVQRRNERVKRRVASGETPAHLITIFKIAVDHVMKRKRFTLFSAACTVLVQLLSAGGANSAGGDGDIDPRIGIAETFLRARILAGENTVSDSGLRPLPDGKNDNLIHAVTAAMLKFLALDDDKDISSDPRKVEDDENNERREPDEETEDNEKQNDVKAWRATLRECLNITSSCAQSDEMCKALDEGNTVQSCARLLERYSNSDENVSTSALHLLGKLAQRDSCKTSVFDSGMNAARVAASTWAVHSERVAMTFCALVAQLSLRRPDISRKFAVDGTASDVIDLMITHSEKISVLRQGCYSIRNICSRDEDARQAVRKTEKAEQVLRGIHRKVPRLSDAAYYALKEMNVLADDELRWDARYGTRPSAMASVGKGIGGVS